MKNTVEFFSSEYATHSSKRKKQRDIQKNNLRNGQEIFFMAVPRIIFNMPQTKASLQLQEATHDETNKELMGPFPTIGPSHYWQNSIGKKRAIAIAFATTVPSTQIRKSIFLAKQISSYVLTLSTTNTSLFYHRDFRKKHVCRTSKKIADQHLRESTPTQTHASYFFYPLIVPLSCQKFLPE